VRVKAEGEEVALAEEPPQATNVVDLMQVLQNSLAQAAGAAGGGKPAPSRKAKPASRKALAREPAGMATKKPAAKNASPVKAGASVPGRGRGTGEDELRQLSKAELYQRATDQDIAGRSKMPQPAHRRPRPHRPSAQEEPRLTPAIASANGSGQHHRACVRFCSNRDYALRRADTCLRQAVASGAAPLRGAPCRRGQRPSATRIAGDAASVAVHTPDASEQVYAR
jgi:hypothetical protein